MAIFNDKITIDTQTLFINADKIKKLLIYDVNKTLGEVDFKTKSIRLMKIDFIEWEKQKLSNDLLSNLKKLASHQMPESYLVIENYPAHRRFFQRAWKDDVARTRAFYDVRHQRILYNYHQELSVLKDSFIGHTYRSYEAILREILEYIAQTEEISNRFSNIDKRWDDFLDFFIKYPLHELVEQFQQRTDLAFMPLMKRFIYILQQTSIIEPEQEEIFNLNLYSRQDYSAHFPLDQDEVYALDDEQKKLTYANQIKIITIEEKKTARRFQYLLKWLKRVTQKTDSLNTISLQIKEAELAGVIGDHVYFYN